MSSKEPKVTRKKKTSTSPTVVVETWKELRVVVGTIFIDEKSIPRMQCLMSDNSIWICTMDGRDWVKAVLPIDELTRRFWQDQGGVVKVPA